MKKITMIFHQQEMFDEFMEINKSAEKQYGKENFSVEENEEEVIINVINRV